MKKYDLYMVKVVVDGVEKVIKTNRDTTSFMEMKDLYSKTKEKVNYGDIMLVGVNSTGYTTIYSKNVEKKEEIDGVISNLIDNINWILEYSKKANQLESSMNMSKDMYLKNVELFNDYELDDEEESLRIKGKIFDELREILLLRRKVKYNNLLAQKIASNLNLNSILDTINSSIKSISKNSSINISTDDIEMKNKYDIKDFFDLSTIEKISEMRKENDKILITEDKIVGFDKTKNKDNKNKNETKEDVEPKMIKSSLSEVIGDIIYKSENFDFDNLNMICVDKETFRGVQKEHIDGFIKKRVEKFNLITRDDRNIHCYNFKEVVMDKPNICGEIIYQSDNLDFCKNRTICIKEEKFINVANAHLKNFIKNKSKNFNLITKNNSIIHCYKFETIEEEKTKKLIS